MRILISVSGSSLGVYLESIIKSESFKPGFPISATVFVASVSAVNLTVTGSILGNALVRGSASERDQLVCDTLYELMVPLGQVRVKLEASHW